MRITPLLLLCAGLSIAQISHSQKKSTAAAPGPAITAETFGALTFRAVGPAVTSGRISDFAVNPSNHSEYFVAASSGGVWKTTNHGVTYQPVFDAQGSYSIGCVTMDPTHPHIVWVGTGENNNQRSVAYGDGVYKSTDGGMSWTNTGLKESEHIANIVVDPRNSDVVYVAAYGPLWREGGERGVYKSTDGGTSWTLIHSVSPYTGCNNLIMDPHNPDVLYAAFHQRMRKVFTYIGGGPESALYKSTDAGKTWKKLSGGLPSGDIGRIGIDASKAQKGLVYAVVEAKDGKGGIYRSTSGGDAWEKRSGFYTSGNYYNELTCDPANPDRIFITDTYYQVSDDGGSSVRNLGEINKHIDNHCIWIDPNDTNHLLVGCDGGVYETWDFAGNWHFKPNLPVTQFYKVSTDNALPFYHIHGGTQDNLSLGGPSRTTSVNGIENADWYTTSTGDGFETQVDPTNPDIIYAQSQYGGLVRFDRKSGEMLFIKPIEGENEPAYRWNWDAPLLISSHNPQRLYFGANKLFRTDNRGSSWKAISPDLSRQLDRNTFEVMGKVWSVDAVAKNQSTDIFGQLTTVAESTMDENLLWAGTDDGLIHVTTDGGANWRKIDNLPGVPAQSYVNQIIASLHDKNTAYVCFNHHRYGDFKPYVLKTTDLGKTWTAIQSDLPQRGSVYTIAEDHVDKNLLFVGTEFGVFASQNGGKSWMQLRSGLPTVAVRDIEIQRRENDLVLGTFGRGFYVLDDYTPLRHFKAEQLNQEAVILPVKESLLFVESQPYGLRAKAHQGSSFHAAPNPAVGAVITVYTKNELKTLKQKRQVAEKAKYEKNQKVYYPPIDSLRMEDQEIPPHYILTIRDSKGNTVRHLDAGTSSGLQRMVWDFHYATPASYNNRYTPGPDELFGGEEKGHLAAPGEYTATLYKSQNGVLTALTAPQPFTVKSLGNSTIPNNPAEYVAFCTRVAELSKAVSAAGDLTGGIAQRLDAIRQVIVDMPADPSKELAEAHRLQQVLNGLTHSLYGDSSKARREMETEPSISGRVGTVQYALFESTSEIPQMYRDSFAIASKQFTQFLKDLRKLDEELRILEEEMEMAGAPYTPGRWPKWD
jgi:photosystem II stability/assembly factor-like uncharacterized protein